MPLARIRSFDPEAIAFLAAQLAESGYTLQFVRPDEAGLEDADLELTVIRRDLDEALQIAEAEAERLGVDVIVVPGAIPIPAVAPEAAVVPVSAPAEPAVVVPPQPVPGIPKASAIQFARYAARFGRAARTSAESAAHVIGRGTGSAIVALETTANATRDAVAAAQENLVEFADALRTRASDWKLRYQSARSLRRESRRRTVVTPVIVARAARLRRPLPFWMRERIYKGAAIASVVAAAAVIGWSIAGAGGPANPVQKPASAVQEQVPFGPASVSAPARPAPTPVSERSTPAPRPALRLHSRHVDSNSQHVESEQLFADGEPEIIVRHFKRKPASQQAKVKVKDGVKIISEE